MHPLFLPPPPTAPLHTSAHAPILARRPNQGFALDAIHFINRGIVETWTHDSSQSTLTNNDNFGFDEYFASCVARKPPQAGRWAKAVTYCDLMSLTVEALDASLIGDPVFEAVSALALGLELSLRSIALGLELGSARPSRAPRAPVLGSKSTSALLSIRSQILARALSLTLVCMSRVLQAIGESRRQAMAAEKTRALVRQVRNLPRSPSRPWPPPTFDGVCARDLVLQASRRGSVMPRASPTASRWAKGGKGLSSLVNQVARQSSSSPNGIGTSARGGSPLSGGGGSSGGLSACVKLGLRIKEEDQDEVCIRRLQSLAASITAHGGPYPSTSRLRRCSSCARAPRCAQAEMAAAMTAATINGTEDTFPKPTPSKLRSALIRAASRVANEAPIATAQLGASGMRSPCISLLSMASPTFDGLLPPPWATLTFDGVYAVVSVQGQPPRGRLEGLRRRTEGLRTLRRWQRRMAPSLSRVACLWTTRPKAR